MPDERGRPLLSEMCPVGLLPAAVCGIDIRDMLAGAAAMDERCQYATTYGRTPRCWRPVLQYIAMQEMGINVQVVMPYADSLKYMADWFCQLWAESLGKNVTRKGMACQRGPDPGQGSGRDRPAQPAPALHRGPL